MKNLKKFAALLLAGAMALLMLTAYGGGGGGGSVNNPEEQKVLTQIGNQKGVQVPMTHSFVEWQKSICERISKVRCSSATTSSSPRSMWKARKKST